MIRSLPGLIWFAGGAALAAQEHRTAIPAPQEPLATVRILAAGALAEDPGRPDQPPVVSLQQIAGFAARFVDPPLRDDEEIEALGERTLVGLLRPRQYDWLQRFVATNARQRPRMVDVQCHFVRMHQGPFDRLAAPLLVRKGKRHRYVVLARGAKTAKYLADLPRVRGVSVVHAPRLLALPTQRAHLSILSQTTYVKDFEARFDADGKVTSVEPVPGIAKDGMWLESTCGFVADGELGLVLKAHWSELKRPIKEVQLHVKDCATSLKIGVPELQVAELETDVRIPGGATVMFELAAADGLHQLAFVTARAVDPDRAHPFDAVDPGK